MKSSLSLETDAAITLPPLFATSICLQPLFSCIFIIHLHLVGLQLFRGFLRTELSDENLEFWIACEDYKNTTNESKRLMKAQRIYNDFIAVRAAREVLPTFWLGRALSLVF